MTVSILISVFNHRQHLRKCLLAIKASEHPVDEVVISDDGSSEDILGLLKENMDILPSRVVYVRQEDRGFRLAKCKNNAIREASGDVLVFVDQDLVFTKRYLMMFIKYLKKKQFLVAYPIRLDERQSALLDDTHIREGNYAPIVQKEQIKGIHRQFFKDLIEEKILGPCRKCNHKPKLRGGVFGVHRDDLLRVNGFDESYEGWGNEDDDLGRRLYCSGVTGRNVFYGEYPLHIYHAVYNAGGQRPNNNFYNSRIKAIQAGETLPVYGLSNPRGDEQPQVTVLKDENREKL